MGKTVVLKDLTIGYHAKGRRYVVASHVGATLRCGELTCLIGSNGIGKSTLLKTMAAFLPPLSGEVLLCGRPLSAYSRRELARHVGVVLTGNPPVENLSVMEVVGLGRSPYTGFWGTLSAADRLVAREAMEQVGIVPLEGRMMKSLSDGERQKTMIAKALAQQTPLLFLDEPTAFLDFPSKVEILQLLRGLSHNLQKTIFLSTHDIELALQLADTLWLMLREADAVRLHVGTPAQLAADGSLARYVGQGHILFDEQTLTMRVKA